MGLLIVYVILVLAGNALAYVVGLAFERPDLIGLGFERPSSLMSLTFFLTAYFLNLWVAWLIAVRVTTPKETNAAA